MIRRAARAAKWVVPLVVVVFIGRAIQANWHEVREAEWELSLAHLAASFLACSFWYWARPRGWTTVLNRFGHAVRFRAIFRVYRRAEMSRFVPGAVWQFVSRVYLLREWGVEPAACLAATLIDFVLAMLAAAPVAALGLGQALPAFEDYYRWAAAAFVLGALTVVHPKLLNAWVGFLARKTGRPYTELKIRWRTIIAIWVMYLAAWIAWAFGAALFVRGVLRIEPAELVHIATSYALAWLAAMLTMIAPAGMGVREGFLGLLLEPILPLGTALSVAVAIRLWMTFCELIWTAVGEWMGSEPSKNLVDRPAP